MNQNQYDKLQKERNESLLELIWPEVKQRMIQGHSPKVIASEMSKEGYFGFSGYPIGVRDIHRLWELSVQSGDKFATESAKVVTLT